MSKFGLDGAVGPQSDVWSSQDANDLPSGTGPAPSPTKDLRFSNSGKHDCFEAWNEFRKRRRCADYGERRGPKGSRLMSLVVVDEICFRG